MTNVRLLTIGKNRTITLRLSINYILFFLYIVNTIFVPYDNFSLKKLSFALLIILNLNKIDLHMGKKKI